MWRPENPRAPVTAWRGRRSSCGGESIQCRVPRVEIVSQPHVLTSSTNPSNPYTASAVKEHLHMILSVHLQNPLVPVGIGGSEMALPKGKKLPRPVKIDVIVGQPIHPPKTEGQRTSRRAVHELTLQLRDEIQRLFDEAQEKAGV